MNLTDTQKSFIKFLMENRENINNRYPVKEYFDNILNSREMRIEITKSTNTLYLFKAIDGRLTLKLVENTVSSISDLYVIIIELSDLLTDLEGHNLLRTYSKPPITLDKIILGIPETISGKTLGPDTDVNKIFIDLIEKGVIIKSDLIAFTKKNYNTESERKENFQKKITVMSLITAIIVGLISIILNIYKMYCDCL